MTYLSTGPFLLSNLRARQGQVKIQTLLRATLWRNTYTRAGFRTVSSIRHTADDRLHQEAVIDGRARLSRLWVPTGGISAMQDEDAHSKLLRAGFLRQAHAGVFHLLPLGRRVQDKLEALIDKYMYGLGASKLALSSISSEALWAKSGRLSSVGPELFRFKDRKEVPYLLSPTHEEEMTSLVSGTVKSYKELPVRLYQISRKYRDEARPRHGLLRSREFVMKDLYTFDYSSTLALATYHQVREAYTRLFDELKLPYLVAEADSGDMGGNLSHEFHFPTLKGEDNVISCTKCDYVANEELAESPILTPDIKVESETTSTSREDFQLIAANKSVNELQVWRGISRDRLTLINVWYSLPNSRSPDASPDIGASEINTYAIKVVLPELDSSVDNPLPFWSNETKNETLGFVSRRLVNLVDGRLSSSVFAKIESADSQIPIWPTLLKPYRNVKIETISQDPLTGHALNLLRIKNDDPCPRCSEGTLEVQKAVELGHTFHLGTRYSDPMMASVAGPAKLEKGEGTAPRAPSEVVASNFNQQVPIQMGCHGIGVTRMIGAVADTLADEKGLNWPRVMAPFEIVIVPGKDVEDGALEVYDTLSRSQPTSDGSFLDLVLDDRTKSFPWKMQDADLVGYPIIVVVGRKWKGERVCEVQCRRLKLREEVAIGELLSFVKSLLAKI